MITVRWLVVVVYVQTIQEKPEQNYSNTDELFKAAYLHEIVYKS